MHYSSQTPDNVREVRNDNCVEICQLGQSASQVGRSVLIRVNMTDQEELLDNTLGGGHNAAFITHQIAKEGKGGI